ncbi:hypothetical protein MNB_SV-3-1635 [hydrothermal vent metagenome]|uniref:Outer membrane porin n=1 Tax=hydrothermal vent metagenome TaxID=652676 RepID=A0A1W1CBQ2_9ZZZZ
MKKTLLLSVVASTMIMAGGDIAPVEPVVETPAPVATGWDFGGQAVVYYQTRDSKANDLFSKEASGAAAGLQVHAVNKDIFAGIGAGFEVSGISDLYLAPEVVSYLVQSANNRVNAEDLLNNRASVDSGAEITQAYLTYAFGNTSIKLGRQQLPKALSPFAFSEGWNVFKNTYDAALVVNTDLTDTTIVFADVKGANNIFNLGNFSEVNANDGVYMLTAQNKSVENLTLTGSYYYAPNVIGTDDLHILWADAKYNAGSFNVALQGGTVKSDGFVNDTVAFGAKAGGNFGMFDASVAYSHVDDGDAGVFNVGGVKTPLYTQMILNQNAIKSDNDTVVARVGAKALGGKFGLAYGYSDLGSAALATDKTHKGSGKYQEVDLTYKTKVFNDSTTLFAGYVYTDDDRMKDSQNLIRVWGRYNF